VRAAVADEVSSIVRNSLVGNLPLVGTLGFRGRICYDAGNKRSRYGVSLSAHQPSELGFHPERAATHDTVNIVNLGSRYPLEFHVRVYQILVDQRSNSQHN
jgi:hypothetical protein